MSDKPDPIRMTIPQVARHAARTWPERPALRFQGETVTYAQQYDRICRFAHALKAQGIGRGDHVATILGGGPEWFYISYAITLVGAVIVPINVTFRSQELVHALRRSDARALIIRDQFRGVDQLALIKELIPELADATPGFLQSETFPKLDTVIAVSREDVRYPGTVAFHDLMRAGAAYQPSAIDAWIDSLTPDAAAYILFTSGSTAFPKPALRAHGSSVGIASHLYAQCFAMEPDDVMMGYSPFYHVGGCIYVTLGTALAGACIALLEYFEPGEVLRTIREEGVTCMSGFDTHLRALANHPDFASTDCSGVHKMTLACGPEWYDTVRQMGFGATSVSHHYGFTEGTSVVMPRAETDEEVRRNSNGQPFHGVSVKIVNPETGEPCGPDEPGEICIRGWTLFQGYYKMPEQTAESFDDEGYFHSGDYGWMDGRGFVYYRGRYKQMIKTGGENVSEREVEMFLEGHPEIRAVQVVGVPDERWGEAVTAMVQTVSGDPLPLQSIKAFCQDRMAGFKIPKHVVPMVGEDWPITPTGKYDKPRLKAMAMERLGRDAV